MTTTVRAGSNRSARTRCAAAAGLFLFGCAIEAAAQARTAVSLTPPNRALWDVAAYAGRQGVNKSEIGPAWDGWYESAAFAASAGFYWTPRLKLEFDAGRSAAADFFTVEQLAIPELFYPYNRTRRHRFTTTSASGAVVYQGFENRWFHPFAAGGVELVNERQRSEAVPATGVIRAGNTIVAPALPDLPAAVDTSLSARPFASAGFKVYVSPRAFLRSELRVPFSRRGPESAIWRAGAGVDF